MPRGPPAPAAHCAPADPVPWASSQATEPTGPARPRRRPSSIPWAELLQRVFRTDVLACPCGGRRVVLSFLTDRRVVGKILEHLGLPATGPPVAPPRNAATPPADAWQDDVPEIQQALR